MSLGIISLIFLFFNSTESALSILPVKVGETLILDIGREVKEWRRIRNGTEEKILPCQTTKDKYCNAWIINNAVIPSDGREHMYNNGTLVIENFQASDSGDYYSHNELERLHYTTDGLIWKLSKSRISVFSIE